MPSLLDAAPLDLTRALRRLGELRSRERQLAVLAAVLGLAGAALMVMGHSAGVPPAIGAAGALALWGLCRGDRRRLLVALVAQGDAGALEDVARLSERLLTIRERRRLARGLRNAAAAGMPGAQVPIMVDPARAADVAERLVALAERFADPVVKVSAQTAAICRRLLCDAQASPLYNPHVPERDLGRILDVLERDFAGRA
jgi:hypothetical protein